MKNGPFTLLEHSPTFPGFALNKSIQTLVLLPLSCRGSAYPQVPFGLPFTGIEHVGP